MADLTGYIYIASNPILKYGLLKIGRTFKAPQKRTDELSSSTSIPSDFQLVYSIPTENNLIVESRIHLLLSEYRFRHNKEFFRIPKRKAIAVVDRVTSLANHQPLPYLHLHNDFPFHRFNKRLGVRFHRILLLIMSYSHNNSIFHNLQGFPPDITDGFLGTHVVQSYIPSKDKSVARTLKEFAIFAQDLTISFDNNESYSPVFNDIRYGKGELCWLFSSVMKRQFISW